MKKMIPLALTFLIWGMVSGCKGKETTGSKLKSGLVSVATISEATENAPSEIQAEAIFRLTNGKIEEIKQPTTGAETFQGIPFLHVFGLDEKPQTIPLEPTKESALGCEVGPKVALLATKTQRERLEAKPMRHLIIGVSGDEIKTQKITLVDAELKNNQWLLQRARTDLYNAYIQLPTSKKQTFDCSAEDMQCKSDESHYKGLTQRQSIQPLFTDYVVLPDKMGVYAIGTFRFTYPDGNESISDTELPTAFYVVHFEEGKAPRILLQDMNINNELVTSYTFVDVIGDVKPELIVQTQGYEWYYYRVFSMGEPILRQEWSGGGGGC